MANDDAWSSGWQQGSGAAQKRKDKGLQSKTAEGRSSKSGIGAIGSLHSGGKVKRTGNYRLRKGEIVLTATQQKEAGIKKGNKKSGTRKRVSSKG